MEYFRSAAWLVKDLPLSFTDDNLDHVKQFAGKISGTVAVGKLECILYV